MPATVVLALDVHPLGKLAHLDRFTVVGCVVVRAPL